MLESPEYDWVRAVAKNAHESLLREYAFNRDARTATTRKYVTDEELDAFEAKLVFDYLTGQP